MEQIKEEQEEANDGESQENINKNGKKEADDFFS